MEIDRFTYLINLNMCSFFKNIVFFCLLLLITSCKSNKFEEINICPISPLQLEVDSTRLSELYDIEIIKLENNRKSQISQVNKLIVNSNGILIYDNSSLPQVFSFDKSGNYINTIGKFGHAKNEYDHILDVSSSASGDSVVFLQYSKIQIFDGKGKYVSTIPIDGQYHWEKIERVANKGYVCASEYTNTSYLLSVCDNLFNIKHDLLDVEDVSIAGGSFVWNPIWCSHDKIIYCDYFYNSFYVNDVNTGETVGYKIETGNFASKEEIEKGNGGKYDHFIDVAFDGECIFGSMVHNMLFKTYKLNINTKEFIIYESIKDWFPKIETYYEGVYYAVLEPSFLLSLVKGNSFCMEQETYENLSKAIEPYVDELCEMDNMYILKLKKKTYK